jgi:alpha-L-rhamnosidase
MKATLLSIAVILASAHPLVGQTLLSQGRPATASSTQSGNYPTNATDGDLTTTRWAAGDSTYPQWWRVDLGAPRNITRAIINWYSSGSRAYQYRIETSNDDTNYNVLVDNTSNAAYGDSTNTFSAVARYVRIYVTGATSGWAGLYECQIFGKGTSPYAADGNTLFLFHFDEAAGSAVFANEGSAGGNAYSVDLTSASSSPPVVTVVSGAAGYTNFGNAANLNTSGYLIGFDANASGAYNGETVDTLAMSQLNLGNGGQTPWTIEAMVQPSATNVNQEIIATDSSVANRGFQFRLNTAGQLELNLLYAGINPKAAIPASGTNAFVANNWYHVAATYDGTNIVLYWTKLSPLLTAANPLSTNAAAVGAAFGAVTGPLCIGNENRAAAGEYFRGLIDEVRISSVARAANEMLVASASIWASPATLSPANPVYAGTWVALSSTTGGTQPMGYFWQSDGGTGGATWTNLPNSTTNTYALNTTGLTPTNYQFRLLVTNVSGAATSSAATLNLLAASGPVLVADTTITPSAVTVGSSVLLSAAFSGNQPISYQWFSGNSPIPGATNNTHAITNAQLSQAGNYFLVASNNPPGLGSRTNASTPAALTVTPVDPTAPGGLMVDLLAYPGRTTVADTAPEFTWIFKPAARGENQNAYRVIVASSATQAAAGNGDVWDSGKVASAESVNVPCGVTLARGSTYCWRVRTWGTTGFASSWSDLQSFTVEATSPQSGARSIYKASANDSTGYNWAGRYQSAYDTVVAPVQVVDKGGGNYFIDFGKDGFGYVTFRLNGSFSGQTVEVRLGEAADGNSVNTAPGGYIRYGSTSVALQNGDVTYEARYASTVTGLYGTGINVTGWAGAVMPFRYVELLNCPGTVTTNDLRQYVLHVPFDENAASFVSSDSTLNAVWELCKYSIKATSFAGAYVDGDRERRPYEADAYINQLCHYGADREYTTARYTYEFLLDNHTWPTEWRFHFPLMAWADYQYTGNDEALAANYNSISNYLRIDRERTSDKLLQGWPNNGTADPSDIIDWPTTERDGYVQVSYSSVINAFHYRDLRLMARIATVLGKTADATNFTARADQIQTAFNSVFWNTSSNLYQDGEGSTHISAHGNFFPMAFGLVPSNRVASVMSYLKTKRMAPSVYGAQYLLEALFEGGEADYAIGLMADDDPTYLRHWWNMISVGSTISLEAWDMTYKSNLDWNHAWGAVPGNIIPRYVLGLKPLTAGFGQVELKPQPGTNLSFAQGTIPTIRGPVFIQVATNTANSFQLLVNLPGNVTATVMLPTLGAANPVALVDGNIVAGARSNNWLIVTNVGSGQHAVWLNTNSSPSATTLYNNWAAGWFGANAALAGQTMDADGDGANNLNEFVAGTNPLDAADRFRIADASYASAGPVMTVTVAGKAGRHYTLQHTFSLSPASWTAADTQTAATDNLTVALHDASLSGHTQAFLRVMVVYP